LRAGVFVRFAPSNLVLAIHELDESHMGRFSFRTKESFFQVCTGHVYRVCKKEICNFCIWWCRKAWSKCSVLFRNDVLFVTTFKYPLRKFCETR